VESSEALGQSFEAPNAEKTEFTQDDKGQTLTKKRKKSMDNEEAVDIEEVFTDAVKSTVHAEACPGIYMGM
jgi:hypothetical protein